jgi:hypothetical protein
LSISSRSRPQASDQNSSRGCGLVHTCTASPDSMSCFTTRLREHATSGAFPPLIRTWTCVSTLLLAWNSIRMPCSARSPRTSDVRLVLGSDDPRVHRDLLPSCVPYDRTPRSPRMHPSRGLASIADALSPPQAARRNVARAGRRRRRGPWGSAHLWPSLTGSTPGCAACMACGLNVRLRRRSGSSARGPARAAAVRRSRKAARRVRAALEAPESSGARGHSLGPGGAPPPASRDSVL